MKRTVKGTIGVSALLLLAACGNRTEIPRAENKKAPVAVKTETVGAADLPAVYEASGTVRARTTAQISSRVMAYVRDVRVKVGDRVRAGQVLAVLDSRDADIRKRQADAAREEAGSAADEAEQSHAAARANLELAEITFGRMKDLYEKTSISRQEFDEAAARVKVARAGLEMAASRRSQVGAKIRQAEEETRAAGLQQGYSTLTAPFAGVISEKAIEPGNLAVPGAPLLTIEAGTGFRLEANVQESLVRSIRPGQAVQVEIEALASELNGRVEEIVPGVDPAARSSVVKISLPPAAGLRTGLFGRARFTTGSKRVLLVPASAISERGQVQWILVAEGGFARSRLVTTGERRGPQIEILSGLSDGEKLIVAIPQGLADGDRIEVKP